MIITLKQQSLEFFLLFFNILLLIVLSFQEINLEKLFKIEFNFLLLFINKTVLKIYKY